ncbi:MAG: hypothetical protein EOP84_30235 [Verrucomicrobiaceae bacterium]|nr:MAG: hypothetical protein EOP84_30235 [Verrucomicrobiaceae bacterium]
MGIDEIMFVTFNPSFTHKPNRYATPHKEFCEDYVNGLVEIGFHHLTIDSVIRHLGPIWRVMHGCTTWVLVASLPIGLCSLIEGYFAWATVCLLLFIGYTGFVYELILKAIERRIFKDARFFELLKGGNSVYFFSRVAG